MAADFAGMMVLSRCISCTHCSARKNTEPTSYFEISKYLSRVSVYRDGVCEQIMISNTRHLLLGVHAGNATSVMQESELGDPQNGWVHFPSCPPTPAALFQMNKFNKNWSSSINYNTSSFL